MDQTTPIWSEKVEATEKVGQRTPEYTIVSTVRYHHALDALFKDQQWELKKWTTKAKEAEAEVRSLKLELHLMKSQLATMREEGILQARTTEGP